MMFKVDSELVNVFETDWYKKIKSETSPGDNMRILFFNKLWLSGSYLKNDCCAAVNRGLTEGVC